MTRDLDFVGNKTSCVTFTDKAHLTLHYPISLCLQRLDIVSH